MLINDHAQRQKALDISRSFIVQAPAGSGKTELLTQRFLHLLAHVQSPEEILAITFTRKAASEMRLRILNALKQAQQNSNTLNPQTEKLAQAVIKVDDKLGWELLSNPNRLSIQTFDSFCKKLTRQMPILSRFGTPSRITEEPNALYEEAAINTLTTSHDENCAQLLTHLDNQFQKATRLLAEMLAKRDQWLPLIMRAHSLTEQRKILEQTLADITQEHIEKCIQLIPNELVDEIKTLSLFASNNSPQVKMTPLDENTFYHEEAWISLGNLLLTSDEQWRKSVDKRIGFPAEKAPEYKAMKQRMIELLNQLAEKESFREALIEMLYIPPKNYEKQQWETLSALLQLLPLAVAQLKLIFHETQQTDYTEIALAATTALGHSDDPTDLALALDYKIQHILIDEFQDTSITQFQLLQQLTSEWTAQDGRTLFVVGDPMQSIYRFRNAEVGLFLRTKQEGIGNLKLETLTLTSNFRSTPELTHWFNDTFQTVFPQTEEISVGAVNYHASLAINSADIHSNVTMHPLINAQTNDEANTIVDIIKTTRAQNPSGTIAILTRARQHLHEILKTLRAHDINYQAVEIDKLNTRPVIQDLFALTRALLYLNDRIAWLSVLRAPWCGLTLSDLHAIANPNPSLTIWESINNFETIKQLSQDGKIRATHLVETLSPFIQNRFRQTVRQRLSTAWNRLNGPMCTQNPSEEKDAEKYFELLDKLDTGGDITEIKKLQEGIEKLFASPNQCSDNDIQVMTIHKAKGLEFDTIILPALERTPHKSDPQLLLWAERPSEHQVNQLLFAPIKPIHKKEDAIYHYLARENNRKNHHENIRLLYVAATRAKQQLHLLGNVKYDPNKQKLSTPPAESFLNLIWHAVKSEFLSTSEMHIATDQPKEEEKLTRQIRRLPTSTFDAPLLSFDSTSQNKIDPRSLVYAAHEEKSIGTVVHQILQTIGNEQPEKWHAGRIEALTPNWRAMLLQLGIAPESLQSALDQVRLAIQNTLSDERGKWILSEHKQARTELALSTSKAHRLYRFAIDRTFIDQDNSRWIIDYKTDRYHEVDLEKWLQQEKEKHQKQLRTYGNLLSQLGTEPIRFGLYFPMIPAWIEWSEQ